MSTTLHSAPSDAELSPASPAIVAREKLDFGLDGDIPRHWFGNDAFKTRFFDAMSTLFPVGERFFIVCVRDFRYRITDPALLEDVKGFIRQEGQHTMVHMRFNERLKEQGIDVDRIERFAEWLLFKFQRGWHSREFTIALTAAVEHLTAIMAHSFFARKDILDKADPRMRAMYAWHAMEEVEHKAVAFDVMQKAAGVGYVRRILAMLNVSLGFPIHTLILTMRMLKDDGFSRRQRLLQFAKGLWWLYGWRGLFSSVLGHYLRYYKPGFHPNEEGQLESYRVWLDNFNRTGDPLQAGDALQAYLS